MLPHTFIHLPGVGPVTERVLWDEGLSTWDDFLSCADLPSRVERRRSELCSILEGSRSRLAASDASFFQGALPAGERWRLYGDFRDRAAFLDIETTGLSPDSSHITMVGIYDAVLLWRMWRQGDKGARDTLVSYNAEDVVSLPRLAEFAYDRLASGLGAPCTSLSPWQRPSLELPYDEDAVTRLRSMRTAHRPRW